MADRIYTIQSAFNAGEISPEVANRSDLEKYSSALTKAHNVLIKPYGAVYKRPGFVFCGRTKYADEDCILQGFHYSRTTSFVLELGDEYLRVHKQGVYTGVELETPFRFYELAGLRFAQSADKMFIASSNHNVQVLSCYAEDDWRLEEMDISNAYVDITNSNEGTMAVSATEGEVTLTASEDTFTAGMVGALVKMWHDMPSSTVTVSGSTTSDALLCGESWSILTHGTWSGTVHIQKSSDGVNWKSYRTYTGSNDTNISESGNFDELTYIRISQSGNMTTDLTAQSYENKGWVQVTKVLSAREAQGTVIEKIGSTTAADSWAISVWCSEYGYPSCIGFFQDRLVLAGSEKYPATVWMSRTGDYYNFTVEEADGTLTDDSAVCLNLITREEHRIRNIMSATDLIILTDGNEWVLSGSTTVKPSEATPKNQTSYGCNDVVPGIVGSRLIYVQYRGKTVMDMGYTFEADAYTGNDLTLLAKHLTRGRTICGMAYKQEPDGVAFFLTTKGTINCLTYNHQQNVYAWSELATKGEIKAICTVAGLEDDELYAVVRRNGVRYLERMSYYPDEATDPHKFIMLDSAMVVEADEPFSEITGLTHLVGQEVQVLGDSYDAGRFVVDDEGCITLFTAVKRAVVGLPYTMKIQLPNLDFNLRDGTMQGRFKKINDVFLRLTDSWGGRVGADDKDMDDITYDSPPPDGIELYTGDIKASVPAGEESGFELRGQITIVNDEPYPFNLASVVRVVTFGG